MKKLKGARKYSLALITILMIQISGLLFCDKPLALSVMNLSYIIVYAAYLDYNIKSKDITLTRSVS